MGTSPKPSGFSKYVTQLSAAGESVYGSRRKIATAAAAVLALMMGYHVIFGQNGLTAYRTKRRDAVDLRQQAQDLQQENERLRNHVDRLTNDPGAIEHEARESLHYTRPGEVIYTMPADKPSK